ncbi:YtxH domain-containing protein [Aliivibrio kagoshimensis]|uniref:YtxH domain-containing protein n=1 Tax=Aliivibrio kagoshimensis TaxID=2910230 RepID=UPI003D0A9B39
MSNDPTTNPYEAYFHAMMEMQKELAKTYMANATNGDASHAMPPPMMHPFMPQMGNPFMHSMGHPFPPGMMPPPHWGQPAPHQQPQQHPHTQPPPPPQNEESNDALFEHAQSMLEGALGEEAGMFKEILGTFGMNDKEFWKGAMVGAAAALLLSNENVRGKLMGMVSGAGDMLKTGGSSVKETATHTASTVRENVATGSEIFKDTVAAGKQGYQDSLDKHKEEFGCKNECEPSNPSDSDIELDSTSEVKEST